jgi:hypothetical protein
MQSCYLLRPLSSPVWYPLSLKKFSRQRETVETKKNMYDMLVAPSAGRTTSWVWKRRSMVLEVVDMNRVNPSLI